ncbi:MAG: hypothetical protein KJ667_03850 [Alphaproteobacteria bacterium]|nr:hypothetical protein [Alphaproteobacteria bacterium]
MDWTVHKACTDINDYELIVERQKSHSGCEQRREAWKWMVAIHGSVVASGVAAEMDKAQQIAVANVPQ